MGKQNGKSKAFKQMRKSTAVFHSLRNSPLSWVTGKTHK